MGFTYKNIHSSKFNLAVQTKPNILPPINLKTQSVPNLPGAHFNGSGFDMLTIELEVGFVADDLRDYHVRLRELADWLRPDVPQVLILDNEPNKFYFAVLSGNTDIERLAGRMGQGTLTFICPDPHAYEAIKRKETLPATVLNEGTAETYPTFDLTVTQDSTRVEIANNSNLTPQGTPRSIILGQIKQIDQTPKERKTLVLHDSMQSTSGWQGASDVDSGYVSGSFGVDENGFYVEQWGDENGEGIKSDWIGPSLQRALPKPLHSFQSDIYIKNMNETNLNGIPVNPTSVGIIEVYLRDANDQMVCKISFGDSWDNAQQNGGAFVTAGKRYKARHDRPGGWNNFDGLIRIVRDSGYYYPYIAQIINGQHTGIVKMGTIIPGPGIGSNDITSIQVAMRKWYGAVRMYQRIKEIKVWDALGEFDYETEVPMEFKAGDKLHINNATGLTLLNGEPRTDLLYVKTDFFSLLEGRNRISLSDNVTGNIEYRHRFL
ncbi:distal tail protein Dit [Virgibacillus sp. FSP13]